MYCYLSLHIETSKNYDLLLMQVICVSRNFCIFSCINSLWQQSRIVQLLWCVFLVICQDLCILNTVLEFVWDFLLVNLTQVIWIYSDVLISYIILWKWWVMVHATKFIQKRILLNFITHRQMPQILLVECTEYKFVGKYYCIYIETPI